MRYYLMNKDVKVAEFTLDKVLGTTVAKNFKVCGKLPIGFKDIDGWLSNRQAAKHRKHILQIMQECGCDTIEGYIKVIHCTSINDTFWVKNEEETVTWDNVSLYSNEFDEVVARLAFEGNGLYGKQFSSTTPEFGVSGAYSKCIIRGRDGRLLLYKRGMEGFANSGREPFCEYLSSELYSIITQERSVLYGLEKLHGKYASRCDIFTTEKFGLVPYGLVGKEFGVQAIGFYEEIGDEDLFRAMLVADAVCFNEDRHAGNHGVLVDNDTLDIVGMAPIYDNNISLLTYAMSSDFDNINVYLNEHNTRLGSDWVETAREALTPKLRSVLINLHGYKFESDGWEKFPKKRIQMLELLVNQQIKRILGKGPVVGFTDITGWDNKVTSGTRTEGMKNGGM